MSEAASIHEWCSRCDGKGRIWYPNGGPWGVGNWGKCDKCDGAGVEKIEPVE
jgi:DnaJ-class molecular chaperone